MDRWSLTVNILLVVVTTVYVLLTYKLAKTATEANRQSRELSVETQRLQVYPQVFLHLELVEGSYEMVVRNLGSNGAEDVDVLLVGQLFDEDVAPAGFMTQYAKPEYLAGDHAFLLEADDEGFFGVYHHFAYYALPPQQQVRVAVGFPVLPDTIYVLLQFRDSFGNNYFRVFWFFNEPGRPRLGGLEPTGASVTTRIGMDFENRVLIAEGDLPHELQASGFNNAWAHAVPSGYLQGWDGLVEDAGIWESV